jgi:hypothetical protein
VLFAADCVGELAESIEIGRVVKGKAFIERQALAVFDLECDVAEIRIE